MKAVWMSVAGVAVFAMSAAAWAQGASAQGGVPAGLGNASLPTEQRVDDLVKRMTLDEKISQMMDGAPAIPRLGIPAYNWWNEGLHGVARSGYATMFPQAIGMAATWDEPLVLEEAGVIANEARAKYNHAIAEGNHGRYFGLTIWSPNINIFRDPRWGRGQETYGEDPYLTATLGTAFVKGLQGTNPKYYEVIATPKHFAVHSGPESTRHKANIEPSAHDLEDTYLPAFRATIVNGHADSLMCAYNAVNGEPACGNTMLLQQTLRDAWGFHGFVTSDCGAVDDFFHGHDTSPDPEHASATAVLAGTDTNCGNTYQHLAQAVHQGLLPESAIDTAVKRLFTARVKLGMFDPKGDVPYNTIPFSADDSAEHRAVAQKAAEEAMVLLKNDGVLPLRSGVKTIAVIGPNAQSLAAIEGNYNAIPSHPVLPVDGMIAGFPGAKVIYAQGSPYTEELTVPAPRSLFGEGLKGEYFSNATLSGAPAATRIDRQIDFDWAHASPMPRVSQTQFSVRWTGTLTAPQPGEYHFGMQVGRCSECLNGKDRDEFTVMLDGKPVNVAPPTPAGEGWNTRTPEMVLTLSDTKPHTLQIEYRHDSPDMPAQASLRWKAPVQAERDEAVAAAKRADVVVAFVGLSPELEGEEMPVHVAGFSGGDRTDIVLPAAQREMLEAVKATGKPLVVVLMNGSAVAVNWAQEHANAILEAWYPGEAGGTAIAETLSGKSDPGGKLPLTFYTGVDQLPPFDDYAMKNRTYRYFSGKPLYGFGYGLSYTHFTFSGLKLSAEQLQAGQPLTVSAELKNTGKVAGDEVAELYLKTPKTDVSPKLALRAFTRVHLAPGESKPVQWKLDPRQLSSVDGQGKRSVSAGEYGVYVGGGQPDESVKEADGVSGKFAVAGSEALPR